MLLTHTHLTMSCIHLVACRIAVVVLCKQVTNSACLLHPRYFKACSLAQQHRMRGMTPLGFFILITDQRLLSYRACSGGFRGCKCTTLGG